MELLLAIAAAALLVAWLRARRAGGARGEDHPVGPTVRPVYLESRSFCGYSAVGEYFHQDGLRSLISEGPAGRPFHVDALLVCERDNPHDANAVAVVIEGCLVGHLPASDAPAYREALDQLGLAGRTAISRAYVDPNWSGEYPRVSLGFTWPPSIDVEGAPSPRAYVEPRPRSYWVRAPLGIVRRAMTATVDGAAIAFVGFNSEDEPALARRAERAGLRASSLSDEKLQLICVGPQADDDEILDLESTRGLLAIDKSAFTKVTTIPRAQRRPA